MDFKSILSDALLRKMTKREYKDAMQYLRLLARHMRQARRREGVA